MIAAIQFFFILLLGGVTVFDIVLSMLNVQYMAKARQKHTGEDLPKVFNENKLDQIEQYSKDYVFFNTISSVFWTAAMIAFIFSGLLNRMVVICSTLKLPFVIQGLIFFLIIIVAEKAIDIPFSLYKIFGIEKKYGFTTQTGRLWLRDFIISLILKSLLASIILFPLLALIRVLPQWWWLPGFFTVSLIEIVMLYFYPVVIAPLFNRFEPLTDESLERKIKQVCGKAGLTISGIFTMDGSKRSKHSNAYFTGLGRTKRIVLFDTLLDALTEDEIAAVFAHESGHWKRKHIMKILGLSLVFTFIGFFIAGNLLHSEILYSPFLVIYTGENTFAGLFILEIVASVVMFFLKPLMLWYSRKNEFEADTIAAELSDAGELKNGLIKLFNENLGELFPHPLYVVWNYSHPPFFQRLRKLEEVGRTKMSNVDGLARNPQ